MIKNRVVNNAAWIIGCRIIQAIMNLVITLISARYLDTSGFGTVNYATAIVAFVIPLMQLGLNSIIVQELVAHPEEEGPHPLQFHHAATPIQSHPQAPPLLLVLLLFPPICSYFSY